MLIFPGIGLGALLAGAPGITDEMLSAAALTLAGMVTESELASGMLFPAVGRLREVFCAVAAAVIRVARGESHDRPASPPCSRTWRPQCGFPLFRLRRGQRGRGARLDAAARAE